MFQDSMELIEYVLDGLKEEQLWSSPGFPTVLQRVEDCNAVQGQKPYIELKEVHYSRLLCTYSTYCSY